MIIEKIQTMKYNFTCSEEEMEMLVNLINKHHPRTYQEELFAEAFESKLEAFIHSQYDPKAENWISVEAK